MDFGADPVALSLNPREAGAEQAGAGQGSIRLRGISSSPLPLPVTHSL